MPWSGSDFSRVHNFSADSSAGIDILASRVDAEFENFEAGLEQTLTRGGNTTPTANLPMGGYRHTNVGAALQGMDYLRADQYSNQTPIFASHSGTAEAMQASTGFALSPLVAGRQVLLSCASVNVTTSITLAVDGGTPIQVLRADGMGPGRGQTQGMHRYVYNGSHWVLMDPLPMSRMYARWKSYEARSITETAGYDPNKGDFTAVAPTTEGQVSSFFTPISASTTCVIPGGIRRVGIQTLMYVQAGATTSTNFAIKMDIATPEGVNVFNAIERDVCVSVPSGITGFTAGPFYKDVFIPDLTVAEGQRVRTMLTSQSTVSLIGHEFHIWAID